MGASGWIPDQGAQPGSTSWRVLYTSQGVKGQRAPADIHVEETMRVGPGNPGIIRIRPMAGYDEKVLNAATRLDAQAAEARLRREACVSESDSQCRKRDEIRKRHP